MSKQETKLYRLLTLALNESAADGEALNALRAARKIIKAGGGIDKCLKVTEPPPPQPARPQPQRGREYERQQRPWTAWEWQGNNNGPTYETVDEMMKRYDRARDEAQRRREERMQAERQAGEETAYRKPTQEEVEDFLKTIDAILGRYK